MIKLRQHFSMPLLWNGGRSRFRFLFLMEEVWGKDINMCKMKLNVNALKYMIPDVVILHLSQISYLNFI
jgi:hypothetical protein